MDETESECSCDSDECCSVCCDDELSWDGWDGVESVNSEEVDSDLNPDVESAIEDAEEGDAYEFVE